MIDGATFNANLTHTFRFYHFEHGSAIHWDDCNIRKDKLGLSWAKLKTSLGWSGIKLAWALNLFLAEFKTFFASFHLTLDLSGLPFCHICLVTFGQREREREIERERETDRERERERDRESLYEFSDDTKTWC